MTEPIINAVTFDGLKEMVGDDFIGELVETFFDEVPGMLADMDQGLAAGDADTFRRAAHSLKSNSASFGADELTALAREMEYLGRDEKLDEAGPKMPGLRAAYDRAAAALEALI